MPPDGDQPHGAMFSALVIATKDGACAQIVPQLAKLGFQVRRAPSSREAIGLCARHNYALVMLDWDGLDMPGLSFLQALEVLPLGRRPRIVFCGSIYDAAEIGHAINAGAADFLLAPIDADLLQFKLQQIGLGLVL